MVWVFFSRQILRFIVLACATLLILSTANAQAPTDGSVRIGIGVGYFNVPNVHINLGYRSATAFGYSGLRFDTEAGLGYGWGASESSGSRYQTGTDRLGRSY